MASKGENQGVQQTDETLAQSAVNETGFGKFNYKIWFVCSIICTNVSLSILSLSFVLPAASCDFKMGTKQKGNLTASPMIGMFIGSYFWGCLADTKGRRMSLMIALFLHGTVEFLASFVPFYWLFLVLKFVSGMAMCGQLTILFTYLAEFQPVSYRNLSLSSLEMAWIIGLLLAACIAWVIVPLDVQYKSSIFSFHSWNMFVLVCSLPALIIGTLFIFLPETPKYLAETGQSTRMLDVLGKMYAENTGEPPTAYYKKLMESENASLRDMAQRAASNTSEKEETARRRRPLTSVFREIVSHTVDLFKSPHLKQTLLMCLSTYFVTSSYYMLILWFPLLFQRYADFQHVNVNRSATVCSVMLERKNKMVEESDPYDCDIEIQSSVYLSSVILALSCIPCALFLLLLIDRLGYIFFLVSSSVLAAIATLCMFLVKTSTQILIVSCVYESLTSITNTIIGCVIVDIYPTQLRSIAAGLAATFNRLGGISGNLLTGSLIDNYCTLLIILVAVQLLTSAVLGTFVRGSKHREEAKDAEGEEKTAAQSKR